MRKGESVIGPDATIIPPLTAEAKRVIIPSRTLKHIDDKLDDFIYILAKTMNTQGGALADLKTCVSRRPATVSTRQNSDRASLASLIRDIRTSVEDIKKRR